MHVICSTFSHLATITINTQKLASDKILNDRKIEPFLQVPPADQAKHPSLSHLFRQASLDYQDLPTNNDKKKHTSTCSGSVVIAAVAAV